jgi:hypothetical protein
MSLLMAQRPQKYKIPKYKEVPCQKCDILIHNNHNRDLSIKSDLPISNGKTLLDCFRLFAHAFAAFPGWCAIATWNWSSSTRWFGGTIIKVAFAYKVENMLAIVTL